MREPRLARIDLSRGGVVIDGNNLLFAVRAQGPRPAISRETLLRQIERWARRTQSAASVVFDGAKPHGPMALQLDSRDVAVRFSAPKSADEVIIDLIYSASDARNLRIVSDDHAILHESSRRGCVATTSTAFVEELFPAEQVAGISNEIEGFPHTEPEKPESSDPAQTRKWLEAFGFDPDDEDEPFEGSDAMMR